VFDRWRDLLDHNCFGRDHASSSWQESQALLYQGKAAMMLIGNYIVANFPADLRDRMAFAPFPTVRSDLGRYEDAPMNTVHVPANARNKQEARRFMAFVMRADVQERLNRMTLQLPVNKEAAIADDRFLMAGHELLARADGFAQYFDRDTSEDLANIAMKGFQEFMLKPQRLPTILAAIERARARIYGPLPHRTPERPDSSLPDGGRPRRPKPARCALAQTRTARRVLHRDSAGTGRPAVRDVRAVSDCCQHPAIALRLGWRGVHELRGPRELPRADG
jgi:hypothetical protein